MTNENYAESINYREPERVSRSASWLLASLPQRRLSAVIDFVFILSFPWLPRHPMRLQQQWLSRLSILALVLALAGGLGALVGHIGLAMAAVLLIWLLAEWWAIARITREVELGRWPNLEGYSAARHMLRSGRTRLQRVRKRSQRVIRTLIAFREAASAFPDGTLILDRNGVLVWFNATACQLLGLRYPGDLGRVFAQLVRDPMVLDWLSKQTEDEAPATLQLPRNPQLRLSLRRIRYSEDASLIVVRDVTKLTKLEQVRRDFVANVSHELRTPLTVINGYLDELDDDDAPQLKGVIEPMRAQSHRMVQIVEDLLALSRLDAKQRAPETPVSLQAMMRALFRDAKALSNGRHIIVLQAQGPEFLLGSEKDLRSAFGNLVTNAIRYTPSGGKISLTFSASASELRFQVVDSGIGIAPEHIPRLTERFYRVSDSRSRETGGTGLGLAIVKHVLELHGAYLDVRSEVSKGSVFAAVLPVQRGQGSLIEFTGD